jgi:PKD repeat protein
MKKHLFNFARLKFLLLILMALPEIAGAQTFFYSSENGDVDVGFRKTGTAQESHEIVAYLGNINDFLVLPHGTSTNLNNFSQQLTNMCPDGFGNLQWSVFSSFNANNTATGSLSTAVGAYPGGTCWFTLARTNVNVQSKTPKRIDGSSEPNLESRMYGTPDGAAFISNELGTTNVNNNQLIVAEPISLASSGEELTTFIGDRNNSAFGDFYGDVINYTVENVTPSPFTSAAVSDFYQVVPNSTSSYGPFVDPITGLTNGAAYYLGSFTLNPNGTLSFTRASLISAGTVTASGTNGFAPLGITFTNTSSSGGTSWVWNFGDGTFVTNSTAANVTHSYANGGNYTVTLTVFGAGGSSSSYTFPASIVVSPKPTIKAALSSGKFLITGTNFPVGVQYRILGATNLLTALANWKPMVTNNFLSNTTFTYTNSPSNSASFFQLVSP